MNLIVTGGAGFIGSSLIRHVLDNTQFNILNIDKLTYAGNLASLEDYSKNNRYHFEKIDICDLSSLNKIFSSFKPNIVMHLAAESHVDKSIESSRKFIDTNIVGTYQLLEASRRYFSNLNKSKNYYFKFHHISTDEVYGDLDINDPPFTEHNLYKPSSPYSASKASSDHLVRSWHRTYDLPVVITNCSNNYGPYQYPEKLIPKTILNCINGLKIPVYGNGKQIRDWLYVDDHVRALLEVAQRGHNGETYNIGGNNEIKNIEIVSMICDLLDELVPNKPCGIKKYTDLINFVDDRPGHDLRYSINSTKIKNTLGWEPQESFETGLTKTIKWFLDNRNWWDTNKEN